MGFCTGTPQSSAVRPPHPASALYRCFESRPWDSTTVRKKEGCESAVVVCGETGKVEGIETKRAPEGKPKGENSHYAQNQAHMRSMQILQVWSKFDCRSIEPH
jgi:hypothetical protein